MIKASVTAYLVAGLMLVGLSNNSAQAAPQALALVNSGGEVTLQCHDGKCAASLSAYCLQKERKVPDSGTTYNFASSDQVRLIGIKPDGSRVELDASKELEIESLRRQVAVSVAIPKSRMDELGLIAVTVDVGKNVTLLPRALAGDDSPLSEAEIALATGPLRQLGTKIVESNPDRISAARWVLRLSDTLRPDTRLTSEARTQFIERARRDKTVAGFSAPARDQAQGLLTVCQVHTKLHGYENLRDCFEQRHDTLLWELNVGFWLADTYGS